MSCDIRTLLFGRPLLGLFVPLLSLVALLVPASSAVAAGEAPGWEVLGHFSPTVLAPGGKGNLFLDVYNTGAVGGAAGVVTDVLPAGLKAVPGGGCTGETVVECPVPSSAPGSGEPAILTIPVSVAAGAAGEGVDRVSVSGGGASNVASASVRAVFGSTVAGPGFSSFDQWFSNADGTTDTQAGSHPYETTLAFSVNTKIENGEELPVGEARDLEFKLPPGSSAIPMRFLSALARSSTKANSGKALSRRNLVRRPRGSVLIM